MNGTKAIFFDMGGVLMHSDKRFTRLDAMKYAMDTPEIQAFLGPDFNLKAYVAEHETFIRETYYNIDTAQPDAWISFRRSFSTFLGRTVPYKMLKTIFWRYVAFMTSCFHLKSGVLDTLRYFRDKGYHMGVISNVYHPSIIYKELFTLWDIIDFFHPLVFSSDLFFKKPDIRIFRYAMSVYPRLEPGEFLFVGDTYAIDIEGAHAAGMKPVWLNTMEDSNNPLNVPVIRSIDELRNLC